MLVHWRKDLLCGFFCQIRLVDKSFNAEKQRAVFALKF